MSREEFIFVLNNMSAKEFILILAESVFIMAGTVIVAMLICLFFYGIYSLFKEFIKVK